MPLVVRWPGVVPAASKRSELVQNLDFAQTLLEIAGVTPPGDMQGESLLPLLDNNEPIEWRKSIYYHFYENPGWASVPRHYGVRTERYKLIHYYRIGQWELFDLQQDPDELDNRIDDPALAQVRQELEVELERLRKEYRVPQTDPEPTMMERLRFFMINQAMNLLMED